MYVSMLFHLRKEFQTSQLGIGDFLGSKASRLTETMQGLEFRVIGFVLRSFRADRAESCGIHSSECRD